MVTIVPDRLSVIFRALADPTRRRIMARLAAGDANVGELAEPFEISRPAVSKHLRVLERAGLVRSTPEGAMTRCAIDASPMREAAEWIERYRLFWGAQLDAVASYLERDSGDTKRPRGGA